MKAPTRILKLKKKKVIVQNRLTNKAPVFFVLFK